MPPQETQLEAGSALEPPAGARCGRSPRLASWTAGGGRGYLHPGLGEVHATGQVLAHKGVGVVGPLEHALQRLQLAAVEGGAVPPLLPLLLLLRAQLVVCKGTRGWSGRRRAGGAGHAACGAPADGDLPPPALTSPQAWRAPRDRSWRRALSRVPFEALSRRLEKLSTADRVLWTSPGTGKGSRSLWTLFVPDNIMFIYIVS